MSELQESLQEILTQKNEFIIPENIKKGITVFGVSGQVEIDSSVVMKTFDTEEELLNDTEVSGNGIGVVKGVSYTIFNKNSVASKLYFPKTVEFGTPITTNKELYFRGIDSGAFTMPRLMISPTKAEFNNDEWDEETQDIIETKVTYESEDGLHYVRTSELDFMDFGNNAIYCEWLESILDAKYFRFLHIESVNDVYQCKELSNDWFKCTDGNYYKLQGLRGFLSHHQYSRFIVRIDAYDENRVVTSSRVYLTNGGYWYITPDNNIRGYVWQSRDGSFSLYVECATFENKEISWENATDYKTPEDLTVESFGSMYLTSPVLSLDSDELCCIGLGYNDADYQNGHAQYCDADGNTTTITDFTEIDSQMGGKSWHKLKEEE